LEKYLPEVIQNPTDITQLQIQATALPMGYIRMLASMCVKK